MADLTKVIEGVATVVLAGASSWLAYYAKTRKAIKDLEEKVGSIEPTPTGLFLTVAQVEENSKRVRRELNLWEDDPPAWAKRMVARSRTQSANDVAFEEQTARSMKEVRDRFRQLEEDVEDLAARIKDRDEDRDEGVTRDEYIQDSKLRAEEMVKVREQLAMANGLLRGVMAAMGYDTEPRHPGPEGR